MKVTIVSNPGGGSDQEDLLHRAVAEALVGLLLESGGSSRRAIGTAGGGGGGGASSGSSLPSENFQLSRGFCFLPTLQSVRVVNDEGITAQCITARPSTLFTTEVFAAGEGAFVEFAVRIDCLGDAAADAPNALLCVGIIDV